MQKYKPVAQEILKTDRVYCNLCGKEIKKDSHGNFQDYLTVEKQWGYFSSKDNETHTFDLCESCYDSLIAQFVIPVEKKEI